MNLQFSSPKRTTRSFVIREGRFTVAQRKHLQELWPSYGIDLTKQAIDFNQHFVEQQPIVLDIGFGSGESLLAIAEQRSDINFVGVEVYRQGIGNLFNHLNKRQLNNVRVINADALDVLQENLSINSLAGILVWFPDPWPKKRHHKRRLVQKDFVQAAARVLQQDGILHLASDWQPYAEHMREVMRSQTQFGLLQTPQNPLLNMTRPSTRFERRGLRLGHKVADLYYRLDKATKS